MATRFADSPNRAKVHPTPQIRFESIKYEGSTFLEHSLFGDFSKIVDAIILGDHFPITFSNTDKGKETYY